MARKTRKTRKARPSSSKLQPPLSLVVTLKYNPNRLSRQLQQTLNSNYTNGASSPAAVATPARTSTPTPRAPSAVPADRTPAAATMPAEAAENGAPTRVYLNSKVTSHVLDGMKVLAKEK